MYSSIHKSLEILFPFPQLSAKIEIYPSILLNSQFSLLNSMKTALSLINQVYEEGWEELDLLGMELTELPPEIGKLVQLKRLIFGKYDRSISLMVCFA